MLNIFSHCLISVCNSRSGSVNLRQFYAFIHFSVNLIDFSKSQPKVSTAKLTLRNKTQEIYSPVIQVSFYVFLKIKSLIDKFNFIIIFNPHMVKLENTDTGYMQQKQDKVPCIR